MKNKRTGTDYFGKLRAILIVLSIFAAVKMLFFALGLDEEYQLVMSYRPVKGDRLFCDMWEPHQSSAFLCSLLMRPYLALVGETGVVLWLRFWGTLIHLGVSIYLWHVLRRIVGGDGAFLVGLIYFNTIPKQIMMPEFGIMQVWFLTLLSLFLIEYYDNSVRNRKYLIFAAFALVLTVLSYPSCLILYFLVAGILWRRSGKGRLADIGILTGICGLCGVIYLAYLLRNNTVEGLFHTLSYIVNGDITHSLSLSDKLLSFGESVSELALLCLAIVLLAAGGTAAMVKRRERKGRATGKEERFRIWMVWMAALSCLVELFCWVILNTGYECMQVHLVVFTVLGVICAVRAKRAAKGGQVICKGENETDRRQLLTGLLLDSIVLALGALAAVVYLTDLELMDSLPHGMSAAIFGITLVMLCCGEKTPGMEEDSAMWEGGAAAAAEVAVDIQTDSRYPGKEKSAAGAVSATDARADHESRAAEASAAVRTGRKRPSTVLAILFIWAFTAVFGKGYTLRSGTGYHNVLQSGGILKYGPGAGTISDYIGAYIYNCDYEDWQSMVQDGDRVLIMVEQVMNLGTIQYLFKDVEISHYSIVNPTAYDERLLEYWEMFPEKAPNVIIFDYWYGQWMTDPEGWLVQYAEKEFGYSSVEDGRYIRVYRKD